MAILMLALGTNGCIRNAVVVLLIPKHTVYGRTNINRGACTHVHIVDIPGWVAKICKLLITTHAFVKLNNSLDLISKLMYVLRFSS